MVVVGSLVGVGVAVVVVVGFGCVVGCFVPLPLLVCVGVGRCVWCVRCSSRAVSCEL